MNPHLPAVSRHGLSALAVVLLSWSTFAGDELSLEQPLGPNPALGPPAFIENVGQWAGEDRFVSLMGTSVVRVRDDGLWLLRSAPLGDGRTVGHQVRIGLTTRISNTSPRGSGQLPGRHHFYQGRDSDQWTTGAAAFSSVEIESLDDGLVQRLSPLHSGVRIDWHVIQTAGASPITLDVDGANSQALDGDGALIVETSLGRLILSPPRLRQETTAQEPDVGLGAFRTAGPGRWELAVPDDWPDGPVTVSTEAVWASYLGSSLGDGAAGVSVNSSGEVAVTGTTISGQFPVTLGAFDEEFNGVAGSVFKADAYVAVFDPGGQALKYASYLGGAGDENVAGCGFADDGSVIVAGQTASPDFPLTDDSVYALGEGFITRLNPTGSSLIYSTFLGGSLLESIDDIVVHGGGNVTVAGWTMSADFPVTRPGFNIGPPAANAQDIFITELDASGTSILWSVLYGGENVDQPRGLAADDFGSVAVVGLTTSTMLPLTATALVSTPGNDLVCVLGDQGATLRYATYYNWSGTGSANAVAFDKLGRIVVSGSTSSSTFPVTAGVVQTELGGGNDATVMCIDPQTGNVIYATYLGGFDQDSGGDVHVDASGIVTIVGATQSPNFPTTPGAYQKAYVGTASDIFLARIDANAERIIYSTYLGGSASDTSPDSAADVSMSGSAIVVSTTKSADFPGTSGSFDRSYNGNSDAIIALLPMLPQGVQKFGASTPGCGGPLVAGALFMPSLGEERFVLTCAAAPSDATNGYLAFSSAGLGAPIKAVGANLWLDPSRLSILPGIRSDSNGWAELRAPIPSDSTLLGMSLAIQFFWQDPCPSRGFSASNALLITVQP